MFRVPFFFFFLPGKEREKTVGGIKTVGDEAGGPRKKQRVETRAEGRGKGGLDSTVIFPRPRQKINGLLVLAQRALLVCMLH